MKKINFSNLNIEARIGEFTRIDARKELGNAIFAEADTLEKDRLARKIHGAPEGFVAFNDEEYELLKAAVSRGFKYSFFCAVEASIKEAEAEHQLSTND